jgi:hypothetical protein
MNVAVHIRSQMCNLNKDFRFRSVQRKLIGDFFDNSQQAANCSVRFFLLNFFVFSDLNSWRIARMTEQLE